MGSSPTKTKLPEKKSYRKKDRKKKFPKKKVTEKKRLPQKKQVTEKLGYRKTGLPKKRLPQKKVNQARRLAESLGAVPNPSGHDDWPIPRSLGARRIGRSLGQTDGQTDGQTVTPQSFFSGRVQVFDQLRWPSRPENRRTTDNANWFSHVIG